MKTWKIFWGLGLILVAVLLVLDALNVIAPLAGIMGEISIFTIVLGLLLLSFAIARLCKGKIGEIFFPLGFIFMLFEKNIATLCGLENENIINNWLVLLIALLLTIGFSILFSGKKHGREVNYRHVGKRGHAGGSLGSSVVYIDSATLDQNYIENDLGSCTVYFENPESYKGGGNIVLENNLGSMTVFVPSSWQVRTNIENNLGSVKTLKNNDANGPLLTISGENNLGAITLTYAD